MKNIYALGVILIALIVIVIIVAKPLKTNSNNSTPTVNSTNSNTDYFDDNAAVMYFWQDGCHYCQQQKPILQELAKQDNLKVKSMDIANKPDMWTQYNISGTPTFIAPDGTKLVGLQDKATLKKFLEKYK